MWPGPVFGNSDLAPPFQRFAELADPVDVTPSQRLDVWGELRQTSANVWARNRRQLTKFPQIDSTLPGLPYFEGLVPGLVIPLWRGQNDRSLKLLLGHRCREILVLRQRRARMREIRFLGFQGPDAAFHISSVQIQNIPPATSQNIINVGRQDPRSTPTRAKEKDA